MRSSLGRRLGLGFAVIAVVAALLAALLVNLAFRSRFDSYLDQQRTARIEQISAAVTTAFSPAGGWDVDRLEQLGPGLAMAGADVRLLDPAGQLIWPTAGSDTAGMAAMHQRMMGSGPLAEPVDVPVTIDGQPRGTLVMALAEGSVPVADQDFRTSVNGLMLAGGLAVAVVASVLGLLLARRITRPVAELTAAAHDLRSGERSRRAAVTGEDEVAELARAFNELASSAEQQESLRQSFAADVAHELRTPLAILRSQLEAVQDGVLDATPEMISSLHEETMRLGRLVADLETMTSADAVSFSLQRIRVDLPDVVRSVVAGLEPRFAERQLQVALRLAPAQVTGDPVRLAQVVTNLLTNAAKFVPAGGRVDVSTGCSNHQVQMTVRDDGPGIPAEEIPRVFDRYFRGSGARANGSGIGLAVVAALVHAHGGTIVAANAESGGAILTVTLPATDPRVADVGPRPPRPSADAGRRQPAATATKERQ
ncbi:two-component sensor histidine kinase [Klenkia terrae]|jgi:two-component system sensor histidine kinase BaeS|nr:two-component sensor histidine kinase [Klenkia terrae]